ncbi:hypothetical protein V1517DRAFT_350759 [Lipomyces orientalis]|uniref:Uncharacterized protein n=1 Tax=Lipomyces orientalis TaxID=1233043 RepID=A0ACC3TWA6_9ASCO
MFDLFSLKRKVAATPDTIPQTPSPAPYSTSSTKRRKVDTDGSRQSQLHVSASSPLLPSALGISSFHSSQSNGTDSHSSDNELYLDAKRRKLVQSSGNYFIPDSQGSSQSSNSTHASANSQTQDGTEKGLQTLRIQSSRKYASGALPSYGQNGYHSLPSWSKASVYRPSTSTPSGPQYLPASVASTSCQVTGPVMSNEPSSASSKSTLPYTPDSMRIDTLSRYKVNVPPETISAPSQKTYPGSASQLWSESSDRRYILPEPTVSPIRGRVSPDKPYSGPPPVIQSWSNISLPLPDRDGASYRNSPHTPGESPVPSPSVTGQAVDGQARSAVSSNYRSSPPSTSKDRPSRGSLYGYPPPPLPLPQLLGRHKHESASDMSSSAKSNHVAPGYASKSVYSIEDSHSSKTKASPRESRILTDFRTPISLPSPMSGPTAENKGSSDHGVVNIATAATSRALGNLRASTSYSRSTSYSKRVTYPESHTRSTDTTSIPYGEMAEQISRSLSTSRTGSSLGNDTDVTAASETQVHHPPIRSTSSSISSAPQSPSTPVATHVSFPSSMSSSTSVKSIHPVLSRLKSSESLQQRRSPGSNLSLSGLPEPKRSESMEPNDMESKSSSLIPITASSTTVSVTQDSINGEGLSSSIHQGPAVRLSDESPSQALTVDDSCSKCGISASVLVEYAKVKEELVVKKKQWEVYFGEDQGEKSVMKEEIESLKEQSGKMQAEIEAIRMDRDKLRMDRDNLKQKLDAQQQFIDELSQQLDAQRDELRRAGAILPSGGADSIGNGVATSMESSAAVNSPPATTESGCSLSETSDGGLNDNEGEAIEPDWPAKGDLNVEVIHQMITRSRASKATNGLERNISNSLVETMQHQSELDHMLKSTTHNAVHITVSISGGVCSW